MKILVLALLLLAAPSAALACKPCESGDTLAHSANNANSIFIGTLSSPVLMKQKETYADDGRDKILSYRVKLIKTLKGNEPKGLVMVSSIADACSRQLFIPDYSKDYIFFADYHEKYKEFKDIYILKNYCAREAVEIDKFDNVNITPFYNAEKDMHEYKLIKLDEFIKNYITQ